MQLSIQGLSKTYSNGTQALRNVNLSITTGMFGLLGPNGAGKSTLMRTLATLQEADSGSAMLDDLNLLENKTGVRKILGYLPQSFGVYPGVSAEEMLDHFATLKGIHHSGERQEIVEALLNQTNLWNDRKKKLGKFSGGMKQRFGIAQALLGNPKLIIVDEPTAGLDPAERHRFHNLLSEIGENIIVILSTHIVEDVSDLCRNMAIIHKGQVVAEGIPAELIARMKDRVFEAIIETGELERYAREFTIISSRHSAGKLRIRIYAEEAPGPSFRGTEPDLEDVYFHNIKSVDTQAEMIIG